jgi:hypothetical protein
LAIFQWLIILTGNYDLFNILTIILAVPLLEDRSLGFLGGNLTTVSIASIASEIDGAVFGIIILLNDIDCQR